VASATTAMQNLALTHNFGFFSSRLALLQEIQQSRFLQSWVIGELVTVLEPPNEPPSCNGANSAGLCISENSLRATQPQGLLRRQCERRSAFPSSIRSAKLHPERPKTVETRIRGLSDHLNELRRIIASG
jgi:hypothetical protein